MRKTDPKARQGPKKPVFIVWPNVRAKGLISDPVSVCIDHHMKNLGLKFVHNALGQGQTLKDLESFVLSAHSSALAPTQNNGADVFRFDVMWGARVQFSHRYNSSQRVCGLKDWGACPGRCFGVL